MFRKKPVYKIILFAVTMLVSVIALTACSCNGLGSLFNLVSGGGKETTTTSAAESSTEPTAAATTTTAAASETTTAKETATTTKPSETTTTKPAESTISHVHDWKYNWEDPATCTDDGKDWYICSKCGAEYYDVIPALGHYWERTGGSPPDCTYDGGKWYTCTRCGEEYVEVLPALGHDFEYVYHMDPLCEDYGYNVYQCKRCLTIEHWDYELYPPLGHNMNGYTSGGMGHTRCCDRCGLEFPDTFEAHDYNGSCKPKPGEETLYHVYYCKFCGYVGFQDVHHMTSGGICVDCGYSGPVG